MSEGIGKCELCGKERPLMRTEFAYWHCGDCDPVEKMSVYIARADLLQFKDEIDAIAEGRS